MDIDDIFSDINDFVPTKSGTSDLAFHNLGSASEESSSEYGAIQRVAGELWPELEKAKSLLSKRAKSLGPGAKGVYGHDERLLVPDILQPPYSGICMLNLKSPKGASFVGTGWLVSPRVVITAGHCVFDTWDGEGLGEVLEVTADFGREGNKTQVKVKASGFTFPKGKWDPENASSTRQFDFAAIQLERSVDTSVFAPLSFGNTGEIDLRGFQVNIAGYPTPSEESRTRPYRMYFQDGVIAKSEPQKVGYSIDTSGGQSGAPIVFFQDGKSVVLGIHNSGRAAIEMNFGARINRPVYELLSLYKERLS